MFRAGDDIHTFGAGDRVGYIRRGKTKISTKVEMGQQCQVRKKEVSVRIGDFSARTQQA